MSVCYNYRTYKGFCQDIFVLLWYNLLIIQKRSCFFIIFYQRIRDLKEDNDLSQLEISKIIRMSEKQYARYERGNVDIPLEKALILADYYNVSLDYIAGRTNDKRGLTRSELSDKETQLIKKFRSLSESGKGRILERIDLLIDEEEKELSQIKEVG